MIQQMVLAIIVSTETWTYDGLVLGAGLEQDLGNGFSLKGEYRYTNYGEESWGQHQII